MELITLKTDITVMFIQVKNFPDEVPEAYSHLEKIISIKRNRRYFGYSQPNKNGVIVYRACAEILDPNEPELYKTETMTIKSGTYASIYIENHMLDADNIPKTFKKLLAHPQLDPNGFCLEIFKNISDPDVNCLVPIV